MGGTADHRRLSVDDALAPIPAVPLTTIERLKSSPYRTFALRFRNDCSEPDIPRCRAGF